MIRMLKIVVLAGIVGALGTGCGNVCDDAADVCGAGDADADGAEADCSGTAECQSQCIVDADSCDVLGNEDLAKCITDCA